MNLKLEQQTMSPEEGAASADSKQDVNPEGASTDLQADNTRLRQEIARNRQVMANAREYVEVAIQLDKAPGGKEIIAKLLKQKETGEPVNLTQAQQAKVEDATAAAGAPTGVTAEQLTEALDVFEQRTFDRENAREANRKIQERAIKELPGYESLYQTPEWLSRKDTIMNLVRADPNRVPAKETDAYWWVEKETYRTLAVENPDIGKVTRTGKPESERRGAIAGVSQKSAAAPEETEENLPSHVKHLKTREARKGKSLTSLYRKTR